MPQVIVESQIFPAKRAQLEKNVSYTRKGRNPKTANTECVVVTQMLSIKIVGWIERDEYIFQEWAGQCHLILSKMQIVLVSDHRLCWHTVMPVGK